MTSLHERWFIDSAAFPLRWAAVADPRALAATGIAAVGVATAAWLWRRGRRNPVVPGPGSLGAGPDSRAVLLGALPLILGLHLAVPLFVSGINLELFAPNLVLREPGSVPLRSPFAAIAAVGQIGIGLALFYGAFARPAALALMALWIAGAIRFGPVLLLEHAIVPGTAATLWITGRGSLAVDALLGHRFARAVRRHLPHALTPLRIGTGLSLATLAFTEKLWNLPLGLAFLERYPVNFLPALGIPLSNEGFLLAAGTVELTAGLLLLANVYVRLGILVLWLPFNITLAAFGWKELVGHLPIYGAMAALAIWGHGGRPDVEALERGLARRPTLGPDRLADAA